LAITIYHEAPPPLLFLPRRKRIEEEKKKKNHGVLLSFGQLGVPHGVARRKMKKRKK